MLIFDGPFLGDSAAGIEKAIPRDGQQMLWRVKNE
jgi:hypothetical protein